MPTLHAAGATDRGRVRETNEDCFGIDLERHVCIVADGMGGHNAGEVASRMVVHEVLGYLATHDASTADWPFGFDDRLSPLANLLRTAIKAANVRIFAAAAGAADLSGMGTTVVAMLVDRSSIVIAHVGDSRMYVIANGKATPLTQDDSWAATMLARDPSLDPGLLRTHPMRNALTAVIGSRPQVEVHVTERAVSPGELLLLTTDGVHGVLDDDRLGLICGREESLERLAMRCVDEALGAGSRDNCTALVARVAGP